VNLPGIPALLFLAFFLVLVPWGAYRSRAVLDRSPGLPTIRYLRHVVAQQVAFLGLALLVAWQDGIAIPIGRIDAHAVAIAAGLLAAGVLLLRPVWERKVRENDPRLALFAPRTRDERRWWVAVSIAAGLSEEIVWRGVMIAVLWWITGSWLAAALVSSMMFGVSHSLQGWRSAAAIGVIAMVMALFVRWADGLLLAAAIHAGYDVVAGLTYGRLLHDSR
jgi:membrane protease YdiL (CAAX protease family)